MRRLRAIRALVAITSVLACAGALAASNDTKSLPPPKALTFGGVEYLHRWSQQNQHEFTPQSDPDLARWRDMLTLNVHEAVRTGEQLAELANRVVGAYQGRGKIINTHSKPRTAQRPAEHMIVAVFGDADFIETTFARFVLVDGVGMVVVYSHRIYGKDVAVSMGEWLKTKGDAMEARLMAWDGMPQPPALKALPQSP